MSYIALNQIKEIKDIKEILTVIIYLDCSFVVFFALQPRKF